MRYDLLVIGSGATAHQGALAAARLGKRVALVEGAEFAPGRLSRLGGRIPLRTIRRALLKLTGTEAGLPVDGGGATAPVSMNELRRQVEHLLHRTRVTVFDPLDELGVDLYRGQARFAGPHEIVVECGSSATPLAGDYVLLACDTKPDRPATVPFDGRWVLDSDDVLWLESIPASLIVVGAGQTGIDAALLFAALGARVTLVEGREPPAETPEIDPDELLLFEARRLGVAVRRGEEAIGFERTEKAGVSVCLRRGDRLLADAVLYAGGRVGDTAGLNLATVGLTPDDRGRLWCDDEQRTWVRHIFVAGEVAGFPRRDRPAEPGGRAVAIAFGESLAGRSLTPSERRLRTIVPRMDPAPILSSRGAPRLSAAYPRAAAPRK